jgi:DNA topoisomerase III
LTSFAAKSRWPAWPTPPARRSEADWLVGINGTRAITAFNSRDGGFFLTTVGRVQTPTLAVVVEREEQIRKFVSRDYWEDSCPVRRRRRPLRRQVVRPSQWKKGRWRSPPRKSADRAWTAQQAQAIADAVRGKKATRHRGVDAQDTQASPGCCST